MPLLHGTVFFCSSITSASQYYRFWLSINISRKNTVSTSHGIRPLFSLRTDTARGPGTLLQPREDLTWKNHHSRTPLYSASCWTWEGSYQFGCFPCFMFEVFKIHMPYGTEHNQSRQGCPCFTMTILKSPRAQLPSSSNCKQQLLIVDQIGNKLSETKGDAR